MSANDAAPAYGLLDRLLHLPAQVVVCEQSSRNKTGHNGDEDWPLYMDANGDEVIFDAEGPGCIRSMWGTHFDENTKLKFYFDGETEPRYTINEIEFFRGEDARFPAPLNNYERRGHFTDLAFCGNSFLPIPFEKSLRITTEGPSRFFHIFYERYPYGTPVKSFTGQEQHPGLLAAFDHLGEDPVNMKGLKVVKQESNDTNNAGEVVTLFETDNEAGVIRKIIIEADGSDEFLKDTRLQIRWDDREYLDVNAPIGMFFSSPHEAENVKSLPLTVEKLEEGRIRLCCYFPMPFWKSARITWRNDSRHWIAKMTTEVHVSPNALDPQRCGYFTTLYHAGKTTYGRDWLLYENPGYGWLAGVVQTMQHSHYCEGDEHFYIDGAVSPQINGTGSEDYYLSCFWPNPRYNTPFACGVGDIAMKGGGHGLGAYREPACYNRMHLEAPIPFYSSIDARIQHGGQSYNDSTYGSLAFCYLRPQPALRQTDFIDVGSTASEAGHAYAATDSTLTGAVTEHPEGMYFLGSIADQGRIHAGGEITFRVAISPDNGGVRLRRRLDQGYARQTADVYIDGQFAGRWGYGYHNEHLRWYDSDFDLHPKFTRGKESLDVKLVVTRDDGRGEFTDFSYSVFCFEAGCAATDTER